jgi:hypothetical protein
LFLLGSLGRLLPNEPRYILPRRVLRSPLPTWLYSCFRARQCSARAV